MIIKTIVYTTIDANAEEKEEELPKVLPPSPVMKLKVVHYIIFLFVIQLERGMAAGPLSLAEMREKTRFGDIFRSNLLGRSSES